MKRLRDKRGRFAKRRKHPGGTIADKILVAVIIQFLIGTIVYHEALAFFQTTPMVAPDVEVPTTPPKEVRIEVIYNWDEERIKEEIRHLFPETPELALAIAQCESGFKMIQSHHMQPYGREESFGIFQIHARAWHDQAVTLGFEKYQTDIKHNLQMARYIYDNHGWYPWSCLKMV